MSRFDRYLERTNEKFKNIVSSGVTFLQTRENEKIIDSVDSSDDDGMLVILNITDDVVITYYNHPMHIDMIRFSNNEYDTISVGLYNSGDEDVNPQFTFFIDKDEFVTLDLIEDNVWAIKENKLPSHFIYPNVVSNIKFPLLSTQDCGIEIGTDNKPYYITHIDAYLTPIMLNKSRLCTVKTPISMVSAQNTHAAKVNSALSEMTNLQRFVIDVGAIIYYRDSDGVFDAYMIHDILQNGLLCKAISSSNPSTEDDDLLRISIKELADEDICLIPPYEPVFIFDSENKENKITILNDDNGSIDLDDVAITDLIENLADCYNSIINSLDIKGISEVYKRKLEGDTILPSRNKKVKSLKAAIEKIDGLHDEIEMITQSCSLYNIWIFNKYTQMMYRYANGLPLFNIEHQLREMLKRIES